MDEIINYFRQMEEVARQRGLYFDPITPYQQQYQKMESCKPLIRGPWEKYQDCMEKKEDCCLQAANNALEELVARNGQLFSQTETR